MDKQYRIVDEAKKFLIEYLKGKSCGYETIHPWRKNWEFTVMHSLRVDAYACRILEEERHALSVDEVTLIRLGAILHDLGRIYQKKEHAVISRAIVHEWLEQNPSIKKEIKETDRLLQIIEKHSLKEEQDEDFCVSVVKDADLLDEIGVMSIFMTSNCIDREEPYFFKLLLDRVEGFELDFCADQMKLLNTKTAKGILEKKCSFINVFAAQLKEELQDVVGIEEVLDSKNPAYL